MFGMLSPELLVTGDIKGGDKGVVTFLISFCRIKLQYHTYLR